MTLNFNCDFFFFFLWFSGVCRRTFLSEWSSMHFRVLTALYDVTCTVFKSNIYIPSLFYVSSIIKRMVHALARGLCPLLCEYCFKYVDTKKQYCDVREREAQLNELGTFYQNISNNVFWTLGPNCIEHCLKSCQLFILNCSISNGKK